MRKRRVFALVLALSLVVSGNGMTVLATEQGVDMPVPTSQEEIQESDSKTEENKDTPDNTEEPPEKVDKPEGENEPPTEEKPPIEDENQKDPEKPEGSDPSAPKDDNAVQEGGQPPAGSDEEGKLEKEPGAAVQEPSVSANDADVKEEPVAQPYVRRMVTFTDDTGMRVTYDANASQLYDYEVENGVLKSVTVRDTGEEVTFEGNVELKQPEEGDKYTSLAANIFGGNTNITYVKLPAGVTTVAAESFKGCTQLKSVYLPATVDTIAAGAFESCTAMTQISVPKSVKNIGNGAFKNDARLHLVYLKDVDYSELEIIGESAFEGCAVLSEFCTDTGFVMPSKIKSIGSAAFRGCKAIKAVDFKGTKLETMGESAFEGCTGLTSLSMGNTLALIPQRAFADCKELVTVTFPVVSGTRTTVGEAAFSGCYRLKQIKLPQFVEKVGENAFQDCTNLTRVEIGYDSIELVKSSFPIENKDLVIIANPESNGYNYAMTYGKQADKDQFYTYKVEDVNGTVMADGKFPGGQIWVAAVPGGAYANNINTLNKNQGVKSDDTKYYICYKQTAGFTLAADSLKCNGQPLKREKGAYYFTMPEGGAVITAEFSSGTPDQITGQKVAVEFSAGVPLNNGKQDEYGYRGVELKVGQTTRLYVLDEDGKTVPASKLKLTSTDSKVATVDSRGLITAVGTGNAQTASAEIKVEVVGGDGNKINFQRTVSVRAAEAESIILKPSDYNESQMKVEELGNGIKTGSINTNIVKSEDFKFTLKANVYDGEDAIGKQLTWTSSDTKIAAVSSGTTDAKNPTNEVTVKKQCEGEATITVTASNAAGAEKAKIVQKFVVRVYQEGYKLASSTVTVNPLQENSGMIELLSTSGTDVSNAGIEIYDQKSTSNTAFSTVLAGQENGDNSSCKKFYIKVDVPTLKNGTYKVRVGVNGTKNEDDWLPLTITVRNTIPAPVIRFNSTRARFNLFYRDGRNTADGEAPVVTTEITRLGGAEIDRVELEALSTKEDDQLFVKNFKIDQVSSDIASGIVKIKRTETPLQYTSRKQPAVTGNLTIYYKGYHESAAKKMRVTMPTCTIAPTYALKETVATYCKDLGEQQQNLVLYDRRSRTREEIKLGRSDHVTASSDRIVVKDNNLTISEDGTIPVSFTPDNGKIRLTLWNDDWDVDRDGNLRQLMYDFQVRVSMTKPTVNISQRSVSLNVWYPETEAQFTLTSNQKGLDIAEGQSFEPVYNRSNQAEIDKLKVTYADGAGTVKITDGTIKKGNYNFKCTPVTNNYSETLRDVILTVRVIDTKPIVRLGRGALQLNKAAVATVTSIDSTQAEGEVSQIPFTVSGKPDGYTLSPTGTGAENTLIKCVTRGKEGAESHFAFKVEEGEDSNTLAVSLKDKNLPAATYVFEMTPRYTSEKANQPLEAKPIRFNVRVYDNGNIRLRVAARGRLNLLNRSGEANDKNGIVYTPTLQNLNGQIIDVKIYDGRTFNKDESAYFNICMIEEGRDKGKFFVAPKEGVSLEYNKDYLVTIWAGVAGYSGSATYNNGVVTDNAIRIRTSQVLPRVTTDKSIINTYLSTKNYNASFVVKPAAGSVGKIESVAFKSDDNKANESFELIQEAREDGSMKVTVHLKDGVEYSNGSTNAVRMYVKYEGQGSKTPETAVPFIMKIKVN